jgi:hypothetical protein
MSPLHFNLMETAVTEPAARAAYREAYVELRLAHLRGLLTGRLDASYGGLSVRAMELARELPADVVDGVCNAIDVLFPQAE